MTSLISIIMGSKSDWPIMKEGADILQKFGVPFEAKVVSAHRTPEAMVDFAVQAQSRGIKVIVAGAGGAAHLPGMVASLTTLPVIGVPINSKHSLDGWDSILSILQMPRGVPVATVALNMASNAALLALRILALRDDDHGHGHAHDGGLGKKLRDYREELASGAGQSLN